MMTPSQAITSVLLKYATFTGRASRSEFWWWTATVFAGVFAAMTLDSVLFPGLWEGGGYLPITDTFIFAILIPDMAVTARRLQDFGIFGAWIPLLVLPAQAVTILASGGEASAGLAQLDTLLMTAQLAIAVLCIRSSDPGPNDYGPNPNEVPQ